jgi:hypothetical protein
MHSRRWRRGGEHGSDVGLYRSWNLSALPSRAQLKRVWYKLWWDKFAVLLGYGAIFRTMCFGDTFETIRSDEL